MVGLSMLKLTRRLRLFSNTRQLCPLMSRSILILLVLAIPSVKTFADGAPLLLGKRGAPPTIVNTSDSPLTKAIIVRLAEYLELCLGARPKILSSAPASGSEPLIIVGTADIARRYRVPLPPSDSEEAFSLATIATPRFIVVVSGTTDRGIKRAIQKLILLTRQQGQELLVPHTNLSTKPWKSMREYTLANWKPDDVRTKFTNRLADKRVDVFRMGDVQVGRYVQMMDDLGFSGVQVTESSFYWSSAGSMEAVQQEIQKVAKAAHSIGQHVSYMVYGAEFTAGWIDPEVIYKPTPGNTAFEDPRVRHGFEKYYDHYCKMAPYVDMVIGHWFDAGRLGDLGDVINYQKLLRQKMLSKNPHLKFAINTWGNRNFPGAILNARMNDFLILEVSMPNYVPMDRRIAFRREAKEKGFEVGMWGWYMTEYESDQVPNMHVNGHVLKEYLNNHRNGAERVLPTTYWSEMDAYHINNIYTMYQAAQLLWNPDGDPDQILMEVVDGIWGPRDGPAVYEAVKLIEDVRSGPTWETFSYRSPKRRDGSADPAEDARRARESLSKLATLKPDPNFISKVTLPVSREALLDLMVPHLEQIRLFAEFRLEFKEIERLKAAGANKEVLAAKIAEIWRPIPEFNTWIGTYGQAEAWRQEQMIRKFCAEAGIVPPVPKWKSSRDRQRALEKIQSQQRVSPEPLMIAVNNIAGEFSLDKSYAKSLLEVLVVEGWLERVVGKEQYRLTQWQEIAFPVRVRLGLYDSR